MASYTENHAEGYQDYTNIIREEELNAAMQEVNCTSLCETVYTTTTANENKNVATRNDQLNEPEAEGITSAQVKEEKLRLLQDQDQVDEEEEELEDLDEELEDLEEDQTEYKSNMHLSEELTEQAGEDEEEYVDIRDLKANMHLPERFIEQVDEGEGDEVLGDFRELKSNLRLPEELTNQPALYSDESSQLVSGEQQEQEKDSRIKRLRIKKPRLAIENDYLYERHEMQEHIESSEDWSPEGGEIDDDVEKQPKKRRKSTFINGSSRKRGRRPKELNSFKPPQQPFRRPLPPPIIPVNGQTPLLKIKALQIPETIMERVTSFVIRQQDGCSKIQVVPKIRKNLLPLLNNNSIKNPSNSTRISYKKATGTNSSSIDSTSDNEKIKPTTKTPISNSEYCANCNVKFTKANPKVNYFRLNNERLTAVEAFKKVFQLQLQKSKILSNVNMDESAGLCGSCGELVSKIYRAVCDFTKKRKPGSYFQQVSTHAMEHGDSSGSLLDASSSSKTKINSPKQVHSVVKKEMVDKSTNYPIEDVVPYNPVQPIMPTKLEDYSKVTALCDICGAGLTKESGLKTHLLLTHSISRDQKSKDFVCGYCGKAYFFQYLLKNHMAVHSDAKPFSCPKQDCNATFKSRASLRTHRIEVHELREQGQTFDCNFCDKKYLRARDLRDHTLARHSEQPQFQCPHCEKYFQRKKNIKTHKCPNRPEQGVVQIPDLPRSNPNRSLTTAIIKKLFPHPDLSKAAETDNNSNNSNNNNNVHIKANSQEDLPLVKNSTPLTPIKQQPVSSQASEIQKVVENIQHSEFHQPPEPILHVDVHGSLVRPTQPQLLQHNTPQIIAHQPMNSATSNPHHRAQIISPATAAVQYTTVPINFPTHPHNSQQQQQQQQHQQVFRIHNLGQHHVIQGELYETVNFLDIFNETRQQQQQQSNNSAAAAAVAGDGHHNTSSTATAAFYQNLLH